MLIPCLPNQGNEFQPWNLIEVNWFPSATASNHSAMTKLFMLVRRLGCRRKLQSSDGHHDLGER